MQVFKQLDLTFPTGPSLVVLGGLTAFAGPLASGRAPFHLEGLLALVELVASLVAARSSAEDRAAPID